jgi:hypothetical protein
VRVHVEVEGWLLSAVSHDGPPWSGASRPYTYIILNSETKIKT